MEPTNSNELHVRGSHVVAVAALIIRPGADEVPRVLAMRRTRDRSAGAGLWETLSGRVEQGEEPLVAVVREIDEECGLTVHVEPRPFAAYAALRRDLPMIVIAYRARWLAGEVRMSSEHDDHAWLTAAAFRARSGLTKLVEVVEDALSKPL